MCILFVVFAVYQKGTDILKVGSGELFNVGARNLIQILCENSKSSN